MSTRPVTLRTFQGPALRAYLPVLARLRIAVFREYPYLYDGDEESEVRYAGRHAEGGTLTAALAFDGDRPVGAATCLSLAEESAAIRAPLVEGGFAAEHTWYFGESVLLPAYRGRGVGRAFFDAREQAALADPACTHAAFCSVERPAHDPARPPGYRPHDAFWSRRGYAKQPHIACVLSWKETGGAADQPHRLVFWTKRLR